MLSKTKYTIASSLLIVFSFLAIIFYANWKVLSYDSDIYQSANEVSTSSIALVFGGGMNKDGSMSQMQYDRVIVATELYKAGKVEELIMTGDDGQNHADEVGAMKKLAVEYGVPDSSVNIDPRGYRTYESCYRASKVYGVASAIVVSQRFHLPRIRYFCEHMGMRTIGMAADLRDYHAIWVPYFREYLARVKGWWQVEVVKPKPVNVK